MTVLDCIGNIKLPVFTHVDVACAAGITEQKAYGACKNLAAQGYLIRRKEGRKIVYSKGNSAIPKTQMVDIPINKRFEYIEKFTHMVANGISPSFLLTGQAGVGKTYSVLKALNDIGKTQDEDFIVVKGHSSPMGLYKTLYYHQDQIIVFDDCDSVWGNQSSVNILKAALDSYDTRMINWNSVASERMDIPSKFEFTGSIIFISNLSAGKLDEAVVSRTITANLILNNDEILDRIESIMHNMETRVHLDLKKEVIDHMREVQDQFRKLSIRTFIRATQIRVGNEDGWKDMIQWCCD
jgi:hypothetical protein